MDDYSNYLNFAAAGLTTAGTISSAKLNAKETKKLLQMEQDYQTEMWNKTNEYNKPTHMVELYEEAGLNPVGMIQGGSSSASSPSSPSAPVVGTGYQSPDFYRLAELVQQSGLIDSQTRKNYADAGLSKAQMDTENMLRESRGKLLSLEANKTEAEIKQINENVENLKTQRFYTDALTDLTKTQKDMLDEQIKWLPLMNESSLKETKAKIVEMYANANLSKSQSAYYSATIGLLDEQIKTERYKQENIQSDTKLNNANSSNIDEDTRSKQITNDVRQDTKESEKFAANAENYGGTILDFVDRAIGSVSKIKDIGFKSRNTKVNERNASTNASRVSLKRSRNYSHSNPNIVIHNHH